MTIRPRTFAVTSAALAGVGALVIATPAIDSDPDPTALLGSSPVSTAVQLVSNVNYAGKDGDNDDDDDDDDNDDYYGYHDDDDDDEDDDEDEDGFGRGLGAVVTDFLDRNEATVLAVTARIPVLYLGPVAVGNSLLANAYYNGYEGSAAGVEGVVSYVTSQISTPPANVLQDFVLGLTSMVPQFNIGPVAVGKSLLATAYFDGYGGSATGLPGVISYVTSQLGVPANPAAVTVSAVTASASPAAVTAVASVGVEDKDIAAVSDLDDGVAEKAAVADVDSPRRTAPEAASDIGGQNTARPTRRVPTVAKAGDSGGQSQARSARSASARSGGGER